MENAINVRVDNLERVASLLGQSQQITNSALAELLGTLSTEISSQVHQEIITKSEEMEHNVITVVSSKIEDAVRSAVNERGLNRSEINQLSKTRNLRLIQLLGNPSSDRYLLLISFYQGAMMKAYRKQFDCAAYGDVDATRFKEALDFIVDFNVEPDYLNWSIQKLHEQYRDGEIEKRKRINAYERYFGIKVD